MSYSNLQKQVLEYDQEKGWSDESPQIALHMSEEVGEIARLMLRKQGYKQEQYSVQELGEELTDLLYLTLKLANNEDVDLDECWQSMWSRYETKKSRLK
jgi:NTP pyrophosphatase (non-canonical NTP hydrolase)